MERIEHIEARRWRVPLDETLHDAKHGAHTHFELITVRVRLSGGLCERRSEPASIRW